MEEGRGIIEQEGDEPLKRTFKRGRNERYAEKRGDTGREMV
jgi:hypothetical protein